MFKKIMKWTGIILLLIVLSVAVTTALRQNLRYDAPYPEISASSDPAIIARGKHLVTGPAHCINCHSTGNSDSLIQLGRESVLSGGVAFRLPVGVIYSKNITPDNETGIGRFTDPEIARSLRFGVHPDGRAVFDFMPFHNTSDEDLTAIISYLRAQKPVVHKVPAHDLNVMGNLVNAFLVKPVGPSGEVPKKVATDTTAAYGKYIALNIAECNGCHTSRDLAGRFTGEPFAGGGAMEHSSNAFYPPNLTTDSSSRIFGWSQEDFINRFRKGTLVPGTPMPWNSFKRMTDDELKAIYAYLHTLKPARTRLRG